MTLSNNQDDFVADDFEVDNPTTVSKDVKPDMQQDGNTDDFVADDFTAEEVPKRKLNDLNWLEKNFTSEGQELTAQRNQNLLKGAISGVSAGFSELLPNMQVEKNAEGTSGKIIGSLLPIGLAAKAIAYPLKAAALAVPKYTKLIGSLGNLLGLSASGGLYEGLEESAEKSLEHGEFIPPSIETIKNQGAKWAALDVGLRTLGWGYRFSKALYDTSSKTGMPVQNVLEDVISKTKNSGKIEKEALSILEQKPIAEIEKEANQIVKTEPVSGPEFEQNVKQRQLDLRNKKIEHKDFSRLSENENIEVRPYLPKEFEAETIIEEAIDNDLNQLVEGHAQRAPTNKQLGENVQADIEKSVAAHKQETDELYDIAKSVEESRTPNTNNTANAIVEEINKLTKGNLNLTPEGYKKAEKQLRDFLTDLGYGVELDESGRIVRAIRHEKKTLAEVVELKKRLNNIINYDLVETSAQDFLKKPVAQLRGEIRTGYGAKNSKARKAFEKAEQKFGEFAEKKGKKSIKGLRTSEKPESIANLIKTPSGLSDIKQVVSKEQFAQIERELLENMKGQSEEKASAFYREIRPQLSEDARSIAEQIIESKAPKNAPARKATQRENIQKKALDDIAQSTITGNRPDIALNLWKTSEGQSLIKHALENNPNKTEVLKYLQDQSFKDFSASVVAPDGSINFKKLETYLKDPATVNNIRLVAGEDGVSFLKNLEKLSNNIKKNASLLEGKIDTASASEREKLRKELEKKGKERLAKTTEKNKLKQKQISEKNQSLIEGKIDKSSAKRRQAEKEQLSRRGSEKLSEVKQRVEDFQKAQEAKEKSGIIYKIDDFLSDYGFKVKGVLSVLGILKFGAAEGIVGAASYEVISRLAKNKAVQEAVKKAALPKSTPVEIMRSIFGIADAIEDSD